MQLPPRIGERFGRLAIIGEQAWTGGRAVVPVRCDCGNKRIVRVDQLRRKGRDPANLSCGCWRREQGRTLAIRTRWSNGHGLSKTPLYLLWASIKRRCENPNNRDYHLYGGRGIKIWAEWRDDAAAFAAYIERELGPRPPGMTLDRKNNDGDYEPGNLRWATYSQQARNKRESYPPGAVVRNQYGSFLSGEGITRQNAARRAAAGERACEVCGADITALQITAITCGKRCRDKRWQASQKTRNAIV